MRHAPGVTEAKAAAARALLALRRACGAEGCDALASASPFRDGTGMRPRAPARAAGASPTIVLASLVLAVAAFHATGPVAAGDATQAAGGASAVAVAEPEGYKSSDYRSPVPSALKGARVVSAERAKPLWEAGGAVFIDVYPRAPKPANLPPQTVWRDPQHATIARAHWLPNVGYGVLAPAVAQYFADKLGELSGGDKARTLVFFCLSNCWMSWNAAKRALELGYTDVAWFPDGTDGWRDELGLPLVAAEPRP